MFSKQVTLLKCWTPYLQKIHNFHLSKEFSMEVGWISIGTTERELNELSKAFKKINVEDILEFLNFWRCFLENSITEISIFINSYVHNSTVVGRLDIYRLNPVISYIFVKFEISSIPFSKRNQSICTGSWDPQFWAHPQVRSSKCWPIFANCWTVHTTNSWNFNSCVTNVSDFHFQAS